MIHDAKRQNHYLNDASSAAMLKIWGQDADQETKLIGQIVAILANIQHVLIVA